MARNQVDTIDVGALTIVPIAAAMVLGVFALNISVFGICSLSQPIVGSGTSAITIPLVLYLGGLGWIVGTNIQTLQEANEWVDETGEVRDGWIPNHPTLVEWVQQDGSPLEHSQRPKLFIGDEFSSAASGSGEQGQKVRKKMGPTVFKIRKYGGALIYIGHDESSIHPMLWRLGKIVKKVSKKKAIVADRISGGQLKDVETTIEGVPPTDWRYNTKEESDWHWSRPTGSGQESGLDEEQAVKPVSMWTMVQCREQGMSPRATAEFVPYSHETVRNWLKEYDNDGEKRDWVDSVEAAIA